MRTKKKTVSLAATNNIPNITSTTNTLIDRFESQTIWHVALLVLLPFFIYIKVTSFQLINMDDAIIISQHFEILSHLKNILIAFKTDAFINPNGDFYRPLQTVSFMLDAFVGGPNPWIFHFTNLIYHLLTVATIYFLFQRLRINQLTAFIAALLFSVHPLLSSAVSWVPARGDLLLGLFGVLSFMTFIKYWTTKKPLYILLHSILFALALFSKESAVLLPLLFLFYYVFLLREKISLDIIKLWPFAIVWILPFVLFYFLRSKVVIYPLPSYVLGFGPFINDLPTIPIVLAKLFIPLQLSTMPLFDKSYTIIGCPILLITIILVVKYAMEKKWLAVMGFVWFMLFIIPPMFFKIYYSKYIIEYYEHRTYLPLIGLMLLIAFMLDMLRKRNAIKIYTWLPICFVLMFSFLASGHSDDFKESISFFSNATEQGNTGACTQRGEMYAQQRDYTNAMSDFDKAIELSNDKYPLAFFDRAKTKLNANKDYKGAEEDFTQAILLDSSYTEAYVNRAEERVANSNIIGALTDIAKAKQLDSNNVSVYNTNAKILTSTLNFREALLLFNKAISMDNSAPDMFNDRAYVKYRLKMYDDAINDCNTAISLYPQFVNAYYNKGVIYLETNKPKIAVTEFDTTLALANNFYFGYFYRGMAKKQLNDMKGACADWNQSVLLGFTMAKDTIARYCK